MIETNNMYHASYYLCEGLKMSDVKKQYDERLGETVYFIFTGDTEELEQNIKLKFDSGLAVCNIRAYLTSVVTIRKILRSTMNNNHKREGNNGNTKESTGTYIKN